MRSPNVFPVCFLVIVCFLQTTPGQEKSQLVKLTTKYEAAIERVNKQYSEEKSTLTNRFLNAWLQAEKELQKSGDLEALLAAKKEREHFMKDRSLASGGTDQIQSLREVYQKSLSGINEREAQEIVGFNNTYYAALEKIATALTKANKIDEAISVKNVIDKMRQVESAPPSAGETAPVSGLPPIGAPRKEMDTFDMATFLVGKTITFPRPDGVNVYYSFQEEGVALWHGPGNQSVERAYKPTKKPRQIFLWWPDRGINGIGRNLITLEEDGVTAEIYEYSPDRTSGGKVTKSR